MNIQRLLIYLFLLLCLNSSCHTQTVKEQQSYPSESPDRSESDTLRFTSGIRAIYQDRKGNFWFGSLQEGVALYTGSRFQYFTTQDGLSDNQIHAIQEDIHGVIWFETQSGVSSYDGHRMVDHTQSGPGAASATFSFLPKATQPSAWMKSEDDLWFAAGNASSVFRYDGKQLHRLDLPPQKVLHSNDNLFAVTDISKGQDRIWFATYAGVFGYNGREFSLILDETVGFDRKKGPLHIRSILEDSKGRLWIGNNGMGVLLKEGDAIRHFSMDYQLFHPKSKRNGEKSPPGTLEHVFTIGEDHQGNIWFGDRDAGIWKFDGSKMQNFTKNEGLVNDFALSIFEDRQKVLWFGMANGQVYQWNGHSFERRF